MFQTRRKMKGSEAISVTIRIIPLAFSLKENPISPNAPQFVKTKANFCVSFRLLMVGRSQ